MDIRTQFMQRNGLDPNNPVDVQKATAFAQQYAASKSKGLVGDLLDAGAQGINQLQAGIAGLQGDIAGQAQNLQEAAAVPLDPLLANRMQGIANASTLAEAAKLGITDPKALAAFVAQSLPASLATAVPGLVTGVAAGVATRNPIAGRAVGAATSGAASGLLEYQNAIIDTLAGYGVDVTNPDTIKEYLDDPEIGPLVREKARLRATIIGTADAASMGLAGTALPLGKVAGGLAETGIQAGLGAGGEAAAQLATTGKVDKPGEVFIEGAAEAVTAIPQGLITAGTEALAMGKKPAIGDTPEQAKLKQELSLRDKQELAANPIDLQEINQSSANIDFKNATDPGKSAFRGATPVPESMSKKGKAKAKATEDLILGEAKQEPKLEQALETPVTSPIQKPATASPKVRSSRLMRESKPTLMKYAKKAGLQVSLKTKKSELVSALASRYDAVSDEALGVIPQTPVNAAPTNAMPEGMMNISEAEKKTLAAIAGSPNTDRNTQKAAKKWLSSLPQRANKIAQVNRALSLPRDTAIDPVLFDKLNTAVEQKRPVLFMRELVETDPFKVFNTPKLAEQAFNEHAKTLSSPAEVEAARKVYMATPTSKRNFITALYNQYKEEPKTFKAPKQLINAFKKVDDAYNSFNDTPEPILVPTELPSDKQVIDQALQQSYLDEFRARNVSLMSFLRTDNKYETNPQQESLYSRGSMFGRFMRKLDWQRTMDTIARVHPIIAPYYVMQNEKVQFAQAASTKAIRNLEAAVNVFGETRINKALEILDEMSRPFQKGVDKAQRLVRGEDGRLKYRNRDGKLIAVDAKTTDAIFTLQDLFKESLALHLQTALSRVGRYGFNPETVTIAEIQADIEQSELTGSRSQAEINALKSTLATGKMLTDMINDNRAYFPHERNRGPFGLAYYVKNKDGSLELVSFSSLPQNERNEVDDEALQAAIKQAREDQIRDGREWFSVDGGPMDNATPFYKTKETIRKYVMRNAKDPALAQEVLISLLSTKGMDTKTMKDTLSALELRDNMEKYFSNLRQRKGYYGYEQENRLDAAASYLLRNAHQSARFRYNQDLNRTYSAIESALLLRPGNEEVRNTLAKYKEEMDSPADEASAIRQFGFWYFLAGNPSTAALQLMNPYINTMAWITQYTDPKTFAKLQVQSISNLATRIPSLSSVTALEGSEQVRLIQQKMRLNPDEAKVMQNLINFGTIDPKFAAEQLGENVVNRFDGTQRRRVVIPKPVKAPLDFLAGMISYSEYVGRINSALLVLESIKSPQALEKAGKFLYNNDPLFKAEVDGRFGGDYRNKEMITKFAINENHGMFGKENRIPFLRGKLGSTVFMFMQYPQHIMLQMGRLLLNRGPEGRRAFFMMAVVYPLIIGGVMAVPGSETIDWLYKWYQKITKDPNPRGFELGIERALKDIGFGDDAASMITHGAVFDGALGIEASQRIAPGFYWQGMLSSFASPNVSPQALSNPEFMGPFSSLYNGVQLSASQITAGENPLYVLAKNFSPTFVKNTIKATEIAAQGKVMNAAGNPIINSVDDPFWGETRIEDTLKQAVGFRSKELAQVSNIRRLDEEIGAIQAERTSEFNGRAALALYRARREADPQLRSQYIQEVRQALADAFAYNQSLDKPRPTKDVLRGFKTGVKKRLNALENPFETSRKNTAETVKSEYIVPEEVKDRLRDKPTK